MGELGPKEQARMMQFIGYLMERDLKKIHLIVLSSAICVARDMSFEDFKEMIDTTCDKAAELGL